MKYFPRVFRYLRPYWRLAVLSIVIMVAGALVALLVPWPLQLLVDNVLGSKPLQPKLAHAFGRLAADRYHLLVAVVVGGFLYMWKKGVLDWAMARPEPKR